MWYSDGVVVVRKLSLDGVVAGGESREDVDGDGIDESRGLMSALGEGGRARAGETDGTRVIEDWLLGRLL